MNERFVVARGMISAKSRNSGRTEAWLRKLQLQKAMTLLDKYGAEGVAALSAATPVDSGQTAASWYYEVEHDGRGFSLIFRNSHVEDGQVIAILLHYGHGTGTGGYVQGRDFVNNAVQPIFDRLAEEAWKEVIS